MAEFKLVLSKKDGKSSQKIIKDKEAQALLKKRIGDKISGSDIGMEGYELEITGGSDKCGFPMRKGILQVRQRITVEGEGTGFSGKDRNKKKRKGLKIKKTVCGEMIDSGIVQVNLKILKEGKVEKKEEASKAEEKVEAEKPVEEAPTKKKSGEKEEEKPEDEIKDKTVEGEAPAKEKSAEESKEEPKEKDKPIEEKEEGEKEETK
jgi:small subunit ribosomal protein S6e